VLWQCHEADNRKLAMSQADIARRDSHPLLSNHNSFVMAALKAADEDSHNASVDITGAYLLVDMTNDVLISQSLLR
jgi:hypothetical protein